MLVRQTKGVCLSFAVQARLQHSRQIAEDGQGGQNGHGAHVRMASRAVRGQHPAGDGSLRHSAVHSRRSDQELPGYRWQAGVGPWGHAPRCRGGQGSSEPGPQDQERRHSGGSAR